ncbi:MAG: fatty acid desaturase, partial [Candidatus Methylomirabilis sp.]|nr:fatty acid desaturase [Deltaproteobacteria bacterium]
MVLMHVACLGAFWTGVGAADIALLLVTYWARMFGITGGYHRYFSHKAYKTGRVFQFALAFLGGTASQKGALWWAANHRHHHRFSDMPEDLHSPIQKGFWWSHMGWIVCSKYEETRYDLIKDFAKYPELRWLNKYWMVPPIVLGALTFLVGGWSGLVWGFAISTVVLWHSTFVINSLAHVFGGRRYHTTDTSRNNFALAMLTMGEGWHNNHHH